LYAELDAVSGEWFRGAMVLCSPRTNFQRRASVTFVADVRKKTRRYLARDVVFAALLVLSVAGHSQAQTNQASADQQALEGTWKLVSYVGEDAATGAKSDVMGSHPSGYANFGADGHMILMIVGSDRKKPAGPTATPEEAEALIRSMLAYAGTYTIDGNAKTVTFHIEISWDQARAGQDHLRKFKIEGERLTLITEPSTDPATGKKTVRTVTWERAVR
jgi:hypothetical protein